jgi:hypothetical protein
MTEKHLIASIGKKYMEMSKADRVREINGMSKDGKKFMKRFFPTFYAEALEARSNEDSEMTKTAHHSAGK